MVCVLLGYLKSGVRIGRQQQQGKPLFKMTLLSVVTIILRLQCFWPELTNSFYSAGLINSPVHGVKRFPRGAIRHHPAKY